MKYYYKVWKWENGAKSTEYTRHIIAPFFHEECLNQTLSTAEIVLDCMPIATKKAFPPKTKFRVERYLKADFSDEPKIFDYVVQNDNVEEYVGCPDICCHRIELISPSVTAQGMHVDNISLTYELQDATLNYKTTLSDESLVATSVLSNGYATAIRQTDSFSDIDITIGGGGGTGVV